MSYKSLIIILLLVNPSPVEARSLGLYSSRRRVKRRNCILYNSPTKEICDKKFPNRISAEAYRKYEKDQGLIYLIFIIIFLIINICW